MNKAIWITKLTRVVVTLTSIPPRFSGLQECLVSLLRQSCRIDEINLYLPKNYRRFPGSYALPIVPSGVHVRQVEADYGPATKVLPAAAKYRGTDTIILFCDDDKIYDPNWATHLVNRAKPHPDQCVVGVGANVSEFCDLEWESRREPLAKFRRKDLKYRAKRAMSLGRWKPRRIQGSGFVDILCGWAGCVVRPEFFLPSDFHIPDILWTVDDVWLSGCLERNGVPIWLEHLPSKMQPKSGSNDTENNALRTLNYKDHDRVKANQACVRYFREVHGIWGGARPADRPAAQILSSHEFAP